MERAFTKTFAGLITASLLVALAGCSTEAPQAADDGKIHVVASMPVWADIARQVGGTNVVVESLIKDTSRDPHSYEATARDQLAVDQAEVVLVNGHGYDDFASKLAESAKGAKLFVASDEQTAVDANINEHIWFSFAAVKQVSAKLADLFAQLDKTNASTYEANLANYSEQIDALIMQEKAIEPSTKGKTYFATEPVAYWLLTDLGFVDKTPKSFSDAIENETDVPPKAMQIATNLITKKQVDVLVVNLQTENAQIEKLVSLAASVMLRATTFDEVIDDGAQYTKMFGIYLEMLQGVVTGL